MDKKLLKKVGMGVLALLVVWNTMSIHKMSHRAKKMSGFGKGVAAVSHPRGKRALPQMQQGHGKGQQFNRERWSKKDKK